MLAHLDLFAGIAGFTLAAERAGFETIVFVEKDAYCQKVLKKHYPNVPIVEDIRDVEKIKEIVENTRCQYDEGQLFKREHEKANGEGATNSYQRPDSTPRNCIPTGSRSESPATLVTAGFPCQPFSVAGKRGGEGDDRYLWPETLAVIEAIKPIWVLLENVTGIINLALDTVLSDLEGAGYSCETLIIPACAVNAPHRRDRVWIIAHASDNGRNRNDKRSNYEGGIPKNTKQSGSGRTGRIEGHGSDVANSLSTEGRGKGRRLTGRIKDEGRRTAEDGRETIRPGAEAPLSGQSRQAGDIVPDSKGREPRQQTEQERGEGFGRRSEEVAVPDTEGNGIQGRESISDKASCGDWWAVEPELGRVAHGIPHRVDRLKCLGNAIVPEVAYQILKVIADYENNSLQDQR